MAMHIKVGDRVEAIDAIVTGRVSKINGDIISVIDADGFEFEFKASELIAFHSKKNLEQAVYSSNIEVIKQEKAPKKRRLNKGLKPKDRHAPKFEVDLHIHQLTDSTKGMTNFDMLNLQCDTARRQLEFAIKKRIPKMIFIHGVGEGVLKQELETLFARYANVQFYAADYKTYGLGATEVRIFQNVKT